MLMESRLVGQRVVHLGCRVVQYRAHFNRERSLWCGYSVPHFVSPLNFDRVRKGQWDTSLGRVH